MYFIVTSVFTVFAFAQFCTILKEYIKIFRSFYAFFKTFFFPLERGITKERYDIVGGLLWKFAFHIETWDFRPLVVAFYRGFLLDLVHSPPSCISC